MKKHSKKSMSHSDGSKSMHAVHESARRAHHGEPGIHSQRHGGGFVTGHDEMIGHGNVANLPQNVIQHEYPRSRELRGGMLDDTIDDIDAINDFAEGQRLRYMSYQK